MFERLTDQARRVLVHAHEEARMLRHDRVGTEHLLLGVVHERQGLAAEALEALGISPDTVRQHVENRAGRGERAQSGPIPFTWQAKRVLELSLREALRLGVNHIGSEHILLALMRQDDGMAAQVLIQLGADLGRTSRLVRLLHERQRKA